jgi:CHAD domain-containing protein
MTQEVNLIKRIKGANTYTSVVDTEFTELAQTQVIETEPTITVERFFELYETLFFDIPVDGELNSHRYLVEKSTQYLGGNVIDAEKQALIEEINSLRNQLIDINSSFITTNNILE